MPSTMTRSSSRTSGRAWCRPTTAGIARLRATMAVCEVAPPRSVTKPPIFRVLNWMVSAGDRSWATMIRSFVLAAPCAESSARLAHQGLAAPARPPARCRACARAGSCPRSPRTASTSCSICCTSAHSALQRALADQILGQLRQQRIVQDHGVDIDEGRQLRRACRAARLRCAGLPVRCGPSPRPFRSAPLPPVSSRPRTL